MASPLYLWVAGERYELAQDLKWFNAGAKLFSPSGDDITAQKVEQLSERLRELDSVMREDSNA